jgi:hypothetical protein
MWSAEGSFMDVHEALPRSWDPTRSRRAQIYSGRGHARAELMLASASDTGPVIPDRISKSRD